MKPARLLSIAGAAILISSCATMDFTHGKGDFLEISSLIDEGDSGTLAARSALPFLLDGEIVVREEDIVLLWRNLAAAGFSVGTTDGVSVERVSDASHEAFGGTFDTAVFFGKYVPSRARLGRISSVRGEVLIILGTADGLIYGVRLPE